MGFRTGPPQDTGYTRTTDWPVAAGAGFRVNGITGGIGAGVNLSNTTVSTPARTNGWHPTILWLLSFVIAELVLFQLLSRTLNI